MTDVKTRKMPFFPQFSSPTWPSIPSFLVSRGEKYSNNTRRRDIYLNNDRQDMTVNSNVSSSPVEVTACPCHDSHTAFNIHIVRGSDLTPPIIILISIILCVIWNEAYSPSTTMPYRRYALLVFTLFYVSFLTFSFLSHSMLTYLKNSAYILFEEYYSILEPLFRCFKRYSSGDKTVEQISLITTAFFLIDRFTNVKTTESSILKVGVILPILLLPIAIQR